MTAVTVVMVVDSTVRDGRVGRVLRVSVLVLVMLGIGIGIEIGMAAIGNNNYYNSNNSVAGGDDHRYHHRNKRTLECYD